MYKKKEAKRSSYYAVAFALKIAIEDAS